MLQNIFFQKQRKYFCFVIVLIPYFFSDGTLSPSEHPLRIPIEVAPNSNQRLIVMLKLRLWCLLRDTYKLVNLIAVPLLLSTLLLYRSAGHNRPPEMLPLRLDGGRIISPIFMHFGAQCAVYLFLILIYFF